MKLLKMRLQISYGQQKRLKDLIKLIVSEKMLDKNILITGITGFVGSHFADFVRRLLNMLRLCYKKISFI